MKRSLLRVAQVKGYLDDGHVPAREQLHRQLAAHIRKEGAVRRRMLLEEALQRARRHMEIAR